MAEAVYVLCFATSAAVAVLLVRAYRRTRNPVLFWSALGFIGLALNNLILICDVVIFPDVMLRPYRSIPALVGMLLMIFGLIWNDR
jgi:hypothetical protein